MKICHINFSFTIGGVENMIIDILNEQSKDSEVYLVIVNNKYNHELLDRISKRVSLFFIDRPQGNKRGLIYVFRLWLLLAKMRPQVIHCHTHNLINILLPFKKRCVYTVHQIGIPLINLKKYKKLFSISKAVQDDLKKRESIDSELVYNGIDFTKVKSRTNYSFGNSDVFRIIQVGRLQHLQKGQDILVDSLRGLADQGRIEKISVDIIGDGPSQEYLQQLINEKKLEIYITLVGAKDRDWVYENLSSYNLLVQPSRSEGFGLTLIEAIAAGLPVIASNIDGPAEILQNFSSSYLFETENINELSQKIIEVQKDYAINHIEAKCLTSLEKAKKSFSVTNTSNTYMEYYKSMK